MEIKEQKYSRLLCHIIMNVHFFLMSVKFCAACLIYADPYWCSNMILSTLFWQSQISWGAAAGLNLTLSLKTTYAQLSAPFCNTNTMFPGTTASSSLVSGTNSNSTVWGSPSKALRNNTVRPQLIQNYVIMCLRFAQFTSAPLVLLEQLDHLRPEDQTFS